MKISKTAYQALTEALRIYQIKSQTHATVHEDFCMGGPRTWNVNFCAPGHMTPEEARSFANEINHAALIAEALNSMKLEVLHEESTYITDAKIWTESVDAMVQSLEGCRTTLIDVMSEIHFEEQYVKMWGEKK